MVLVNTKTLGAILFTIIAVLVACHAVVMTCYWETFCMGSRDAIRDFGYLFDLSREKNIPTWFSTSQLTAVGLLLVLIALIARRQGAPWGGWAALGGIFGYMSLDETAELHGFWGNLVDGTELMGDAHAGFAWVIPGAVIVAVVVLFFWRWVWALPARTRNMFILAGIVFVTGGLGFEMLGSLLADETFFNPSYLAASTAEEALEMAGVAIMLIGVIDHAQGVATAADAAFNGSVGAAEAWAADDHTQAMVGPEGLEPPTKAL
jgi:hypothetical protein